VREPLLAIALETSGTPGSVAARKGERTVGRRLEAGARHGRDLLPALAACLEDLAARASEIDLVVVGTGPGSYTGLRVGIAAAKALAFAARCPLLGIPSARAIALAAERGGESELLVAIDALRGEVYLSRHGRPRGTVLLEPRLSRSDDIPRLAGAARLVAGSGAALHRAELRALGFEVDDRTEADAEDLLAIGWEERDRAEASREESLRPLYLRASAAEYKIAGVRADDRPGGRSTRPPGLAGKG
jgi:tRNA threonylcarbamoyladenosine biosynthesis protein TsaB